MIKPHPRQDHLWPGIGFSTLMVGLTACGPSAPDSGSATGVRNDKVSIAADYIREHGENFEACFADRPTIVGPGAIQPGAADAIRAPVAVNRLMIAIDASGSMAARIGGETKMDAAKRATTSFLAGVPANTRIGLIAFGHRGTNLPAGKAESCKAVEAVYPLGAGDAAQVGRALQSVRATGWTPLAAAIELAGRSFVPSRTPGAQVVYIVSDGLETCGGDPVAAARALNTGPVQAIVNIIGFDLTPADRAQLRAVAAAGGGAFVEAANGSAVGRALDELRRKAGAVSALSTERFDAGARIAGNSRAVGQYATKVNLCVAHAASAESAGLNDLPAFAAADPVARDAGLAALRERHDAYRARSSNAYDDLLAEATRSNDAIAAQEAASAIRLGVKR
jgi:Ca-activated chloride channel family protein